MTSSDEYFMNHTKINIGLSENPLWGMLYFKTIEQFNSLINIQCTYFKMHICFTFQMFTICKCVCNCYSCIYRNHTQES